MLISLSHRFLLGTFLGFVALVMIFWVSFTGITYDEPFYVSAASEYIHWVKGFFKEPSLKASDIDPYFLVNHEHPPLAKYGMGLFQALFHNGFDPVIASRLFNVLMLCVLIWKCFNFFAVREGNTFGWVFTLCLLSMWRFTGYALMATLDFSLACIWVMGVLCFYEGLCENKAPQSFILKGSVYIWLLNLCKVNGAFFSVCLLPAMLFKKNAFRHMLSFGLMHGLALIGFVLAWPWLWNHTAERLEGYVWNKTYRIEHDAFKQEKSFSEEVKAMKPSSMEVYYLGTWYSKSDHVPWHYALVTFVSGIPVAQVLLSLLGLCLSLRQGNLFGRFVLWHGVWVLLIWSVPVFPRYGGTRFWFLLYAFVAYFSACGCRYLFQFPAWGLKTKIITACMVFMVPFIVQIACFKSYESPTNFKSAFFLNCDHLPLNDLGMTVNGNVLEWLNMHAEKDSRLSVFPMNDLVIQLYQVSGATRDDLKWVPHTAGADYVILVEEQGKIAENTLKLSFAGYQEIRDDFWNGAPSWRRLFKKKTEK